MNLKTVLNMTYNKKKAVGAFNVYNLETVQAVVEVAEKRNSPVIIAFGEGYFSHVDIEVIAALVRKICSEIEVPIVLHLDHAKKKESIIRAIRSGFTSVMYDGSSLTLSDNIAHTRSIVEIAHSVDVSVEGELGYMNSEDGGISPVNSEYSNGYTRAQDAQEFVLKSGVDALAVAVGNAHGLYKGLPQLDFDRLDQIKKAVDVPLVLHGCSGIPAEMIEKVITMGVCKINVNTEISTSAVRAARDFLDMNKDEGLRFERVMTEAKKSMINAIEKYMDILQNER